MGTLAYEHIFLMRKSTSEPADSSFWQDTKTNRKERNTKNLFIAVIIRFLE